MGAKYKVGDLVIVRLDGILRAGVIRDTDNSCGALEISLEIPGENHLLMFIEEDVCNSDCFDPLILDMLKLYSLAKDRLRSED